MKKTNEKAVIGLDIYAESAQIMVYDEYKVLLNLIIKSPTD